MKTLPALRFALAGLVAALIYTSTARLSAADARDTRRKLVLLMKQLLLNRPDGKQVPFLVFPDVTAQGAPWKVLVGPVASRQ